MTGIATSTSKVICFHCRRPRAGCWPTCSARLRALPALPEREASWARQAGRLGLAFAGAAMAGALLGGGLAFLGG